jgi:hypothetical protein
LRSRDKPLGGMTNGEWRINDEFPNDDAPAVCRSGRSSLAIRHSELIRHSSFAIRHFLPLV